MTAIPSVFVATCRHTVQLRELGDLPSVSREKAAGCSCMEQGNNSSSCYNLESVPTPILGIYGFLIAVVVLVTLVGNGVVLVLIVRYKQLRSQSTIATLSLVVADILWGLCYHFPAFASVTAVHWPFGDKGCSVFGFLSFEFLVTRWLVMSVVFFDRFCTVRFPFSYNKHSKYVVTLLIAAAWIIPVLALSLGLGVHISHGSFRPNIPTCLYGCADSDKLCQSYHAIVITMSFQLGAILPLLLYIWLYKRGRLLKLPRVQLGHTIHSSLTQQATAAAKEAPIQDLQAYATFTLIVVTLIVTALPAYIFQLFRSADYNNWCKIPIVVHFVIQLIFLSSTALDPLVIMRDRDFQHCLKGMILFKRRRSVGISSPIVLPNLQRRRNTDISVIETA